MNRSEDLDDPFAGPKANPVKIAIAILALALIIVVTYSYNYWIGPAQ